MKIKKIEKKVALDVQAQGCKNDCVYYKWVRSPYAIGFTGRWQKVTTSFVTKLW